MFKRKVDVVQELHTTYMEIPEDTRKRLESVTGLLIQNVQFLKQSIPAELSPQVGRVGILLLKYVLTNRYDEMCQRLEPYFPQAAKAVKEISQ